MVCADLVGLDSLLINPFNPAFPYAGHGVPLFGLGPVDMPDALPGIVGVGVVKMQLCAHDLDAVLVYPSSIPPGQGPLDCVDSPLARVQNGVIAAANPHHADQPACSLRGGAHCHCSGPAIWRAGGQDELACQSTGQVHPIVLVLGRERDCLHRSCKISELYILGVNQ